jgi:UDP-2,3-diacylglucosamine pyrophosphatase LpxH
MFDVGIDFHDGFLQLVKVKAKIVPEIVVLGEAFHYWEMREANENNFTTTHF